MQSRRTSSTSCISDAYLTSLDGFEGLVELRTLVVDVGRPRIELPTLDMIRLTRCRKLEWIELWRAAQLTNVDVVGLLPHVENLVVEEGHYSPAAISGLPITVVPERRGRRS